MNPSSPIPSTARSILSPQSAFAILCGIILFTVLVRIPYKPKHETPEDRYAADPFFRGTTGAVTPASIDGSTIPAWVPETFPLPPAFDKEPVTSIAFTEKRLFVTNASGTLFGISPDGAVVSTFRFEGEKHPVRLRLAAQQNRLYAAGENGTLYRFNENGVLEASINLSEELTTAPFFLGKNLVVGGYTTRGNLSFLVYVDAQDFKTTWFTPWLKTRITKLAPFGKDQVLGIGSPVSAVVNRESGMVRVIVPLQVDGGEIVGTPGGWDVVIVNKGSEGRAVDLQRNKILWTVSGPIQGQYAEAGGSLLIHSPKSGAPTLLNPSDGKALGKLPADGAPIKFLKDSFILQSKNLLRIHRGH